MMTSTQLINLFESAVPNISADQAYKLSLFINQAAVDLEYFSVLLRLTAKLADKKNKESVGLGDEELKIILSGLSDHAGLVSELLAVGISAHIWFEHKTAAGLQSGSAPTDAKNPGH